MSRSQHPTNFSGYKSFESGVKIFQFGSGVVRVEIVLVPFDQVVLQNQMTNSSHYVSTTTVPRTPKLGTRLITLRGSQP